MAILFLCIAILKIALLVCAASTDITCRRIPNRICLAIAVIGLADQTLHGPFQFIISLCVALLLFALGVLLYERRLFGGGDLKLFVALAFGFSPPDVVRFIMATALFGGLLAMVHLAMRYLPKPLVSANGSHLRRICTIERWRILRRAPLPYGVAIACGGIWAIVLPIFGG